MLAKTMWESDIEILHAGQIRQFHILEHGKRLRYLDVMGLWLSTAGLGVYWLHLRLDTRPKYYSFQPYRKPPAALLNP